MLTLKDLARKTGLSTSSVSKALSDKPDISPATKRMVCRIAREMHYVPNIVAKSLVTNRTGTLGLVASFLGNPTTIERLKGIQDTCFRYNHILIACLNEGQPKEESRQIEALIARRVDGIIITPTSGISLAGILKESAIPVVLMSEMPSDRKIACDYVGGNDEKGGEIAVRHLAGLGHTRIAYFGNSESGFSDRQILKGYRKTLAALGLPFEPEFVAWKNTSVDALKKNLSRILKTKNRPTAIMAWSDLMAINIIDQAHKLDYRIPEDVSLVGYDNIELLTPMHIPLTTIAQPNYDIGCKAASVLLEKIGKTGSRKCERIRYEPQLVVRKSTMAVSP